VIKSWDVIKKSSFDEECWKEIINIIIKMSSLEILYEDIYELCMKRPLFKLVFV